MTNLKGISMSEFADLLSGAEMVANAMTRVGCAHAVENLLEAIHDARADGHPMSGWNAMEIPPTPSLEWLAELQAPARAILRHPECSGELGDACHRFSSWLNGLSEIVGPLDVPEPTGGAVVVASCGLQRVLLERDAEGWNVHGQEWLFPMAETESLSWHEALLVLACAEQRVDSLAVYDLIQAKP